MPPLKGQTAFITGGASGFGETIAVALAREGVNVVIGDLNPRVEPIAREQAERSGGIVQGLQLDVGNAEQVEQALATVVQRFGALHILGNIAGIYPRATALEMTPEQWDRTINTNLRGVFLCTHFALPYMLEQRYGRIVTMSSGTGVAGNARRSAYAASKAAVMAFTKSVAHEVFEYGITLNCIAPGITDTPMMRAGNTPEDIERALARTRRPLGKPEDALGPFFFFLSDGASMISGTTLFIRNP
ncbi:MAG: SDR family oxidoreductase [Chloroflexi bacterium]|nr:SDR family oxidoreductase [Chloroflexota bacterium]